MNAKVNPIAATLRVLADQLDAGSEGWAYGEAEFSPPDDLGFVRSREVDALIAQYGPTVTALPSGLEGDHVPQPQEVPYLFHVEEADLGNAPQRVRDIVQVSTASAAFLQNRPRVEVHSGYALDRGVRMAVPSIRPWAEFLADFKHRHMRVREGKGIEHMFAITADERQYG